MLFKSYACSYSKTKWNVYAFILSSKLLIINTKTHSNPCYKRNIQDLCNNACQSIGTTHVYVTGVHGMHVLYSWCTSYCGLSSCKWLFLFKRSDPIIPFTDLVAANYLGVGTPSQPVMWLALAPNHDQKVLSLSFFRPWIL